MIDLVNPVLVAAAILLLNGWSFAAFAFDKALARRGAWRVRESTLLTLALLGGTPGAYAGRAVFRHKTRKQPFSNQLHAITILQAVSLCALGGWKLAGLA